MIDERTMPNGLRIVGERIPHFRSVSVGLWIGAGSQYEERDPPGISHFIEHMLFKGTPRYSAKALAEVIDAVGGQMNAFTSKECTCFYAKVVDEHLRLALDVLSDMVLHPLLKKSDIEREKGVVLEEIDMLEDSPEDVANELLMLAHYGDQPLSREIVGTKESVSSITRESIAAYMDRMYRPENAVLSICGNYDPDALYDMAEEMLGEWAGGRFSPAPYRSKDAEPTVLRREKAIEQVHLCLGYPALDIRSKDIYALSLFNSAFGGNSSSRLFQSIREEKGLAYSVYSSYAAMTDTGIFSVYAAVNRENVEETLALIEGEMQKLLRDGFTEKEFSMGREQMKGALILALESSSSRMMGQGRRKLLLGRVQSETEMIDRINAMTYDDVMRVAKETLTGRRSAAVVGKDIGGIAL
ncbi:MAG: M16 family metallopeptidase [Christensenellales bacterium]